MATRFLLPSSSPPLNLAPLSGASWALRSNCLPLKGGKFVRVIFDAFRRPRYAIELECLESLFGTKTDAVSFERIFRDTRIIICCMRTKELEEESKSINKKKGEKGLMWRDESQRCNLERRWEVFISDSPLRKRENLNLALKTSIKRI